MVDSWESPDEKGWERSTIDFAFYHSLVDDEPDTAAPALEALGRVAASWSRMEHHLDALIIQVNKPDHSEELFEQHPVSFSKKLDLIKRWFGRYPPLAEYREDMLYLAARLKELSKESADRLLTRNVLLHSIPASFDADTSTIVLHHMRFLPNGNIHSRHISVTLEQLASFTKLVQLSNTLLGQITQEMFTTEGYEKIRRP